MLMTDMPRTPYSPFRQMLILGETGGVKKTLVFDLSLGRIIADVTLSEK